MEEYIDTRGPWPIYIRGMIAIELFGFKRSITLKVARDEAFRIRYPDNQ